MQDGSRKEHGGITRRISTSLRGTLSGVYTTTRSGILASLLLILAISMPFWIMVAGLHILYGRKGSDLKTSPLPMFPPQHSITRKRSTEAPPNISNCHPNFPQIFIDTSSVSTFSNISIIPTPFYQTYFVQFKKEVIC